MYAQQTLTIDLPSIAKVLSFVLIALGITFSLFVVMDKLTKLEEVAIVKPVTYASIDPVFHDEVKVLISKVRIRPPEVKEIPKTTPALPETPVNTLIAGVWDTISFTNPPIQNAVNTSFSMIDGDVRPIVRVEPKYPIDAARNGIEGWVKLVFSIDPLGQVINAQVLDAEPKRTFDRAALSALKKWKYKAQIVEGKAVTKDGLFVVLDFKLAIE